LLRIKPVIAAIEGRIAAVGRVRTTDRGIERMVSYVNKRASEGSALHVSVMHAGAPERAGELAERVRQVIAPQEVTITECTSAMAVHTGPGFLGLAWQVLEAAPESASTRSHVLRRDVETLRRSLGQLPASVEHPALVVLSGLPGSGKSHLARQISARYPIAVLNSDALRKTLFVRPAYSQKESARLFSSVHRLIEDLLRNGIPTLLDATNLKSAHRRPLYEIAKRTGARLLVVHVSAADAVIRGRLQARRAAPGATDASDATVAVYEMMRREAEPIVHPHITVNATNDIQEAVEMIVGELREVHA
jgi:predicted kinase